MLLESAEHRTSISGRPWRPNSDGYGGVMRRDGLATDSTYLVGDALRNATFCWNVVSLFVPSFLNHPSISISNFLTRPTSVS